MEATAGPGTATSRILHMLAATLRACAMALESLAGGDTQEAAIEMRNMAAVAMRSAQPLAAATTSPLPTAPSASEPASSLTPPTSTEDGRATAPGRIVFHSRFCKNERKGCFHDANSCAGLRLAHTPVLNGPLDQARQFGRRACNISFEE